MGAPEPVGDEEAEREDAAERKEAGEDVPFSEATVGAATDTAIEERLKDVGFEDAESPLEVERGAHLIVVGYDAWTEPVLEELEARDVSVTVVATDPAVADRLSGRPFSVVITEDVDEACFEQAGIDRATAVLVATLDDQLNVLAVLTVMNVAPEMEVATFAGEQQDVPKLRAAGASRVISLGESVAELLVEVSLSERTVAEVVEEIAENR